MRAPSLVCTHMQYGRIRRGMQGEEQLYVNGRRERSQLAVMVVNPVGRNAGHATTLMEGERTLLSSPRQRGIQVSRTRVTFRSLHP